MSSMSQIPATSRGPRRDRRRVRVAAVLSVIVVLVFAVAACGGSSSSSPAPVGTAAAEPSSAEPPASADPGAAADQGLTDFGLTDEEWVTNVEATEALIATCMAEAGFEYVAVDAETIEQAGLAVRAEPGYTREEYKAEWGFGATTRFDDPVKDIGRGPQNTRIFEDLPEADRVAYERTLYGEDTDATFVFTLDEEDFSATGGCTRTAIEQVFTPEQLTGSYVNPKDVLVESHPLAAAGREAWIACMSDAGYDYLDQDEIIGEYEERLEVLLEGEDPESLTGARAEQLTMLQTEEVAVSLVDLECSDKHLDPAIMEAETALFGAPIG